MPIPQACRHRSFRPRRRVLPGLSVLLCTLASPAQDQIGLDVTAPLDLDPAIAERAAAPEWDVRLGLLGAVGPDYEGASNYVSEAVPYARISWRERVIYRGRSIEANLYLDDGVRVGPMLRTRGGRDADDAPLLAGLGDVDRAYEAGAFASFHRGPLRLRINTVKDVANAHDGIVVDLSASLRVPSETPWFSVRLSTSWVDDHYMTSYFGITAAQAMRSGLRAYDAQAGFTDVSLEIGSRVEMTEHVSALVSVGYKRLLGDAAGSPLVHEHGAADQFVAALGALYRF